MKNYFLLIISCCVLYTATAQNWLTTGNSGLTTNSFLGSTDAKDIVFKANSKERGRILNATGTWRFGSANNFVKIDSTGKLTFGGSGSYQVANNKYVFKYASNASKGLFINGTQNQYEFRNSSSAALLFVNTDNGNSGVAGTFKVGAYTLPSTDGANGQILKTNGAGALSWSNDNGNAYTGGSGISIIGTTISNTGDANAADDVNPSLSNLSPTSINQSLLPDADNVKDVGSLSSSWKDIYFKGSIYKGGAKVLNVTGTSTAIGVNAMYTNLSAVENTAVGYYALYSNSSGHGNIANGNEALYFNTEGSYNIASGYTSLYSNTTGSYNVANGYSAVLSNTTGNYNIGIGVNTLYSNTTGNDNIANGSFALYSNKTGYSNVALGVKALASSQANSNNVAIGDSALLNYNDGNFGDYMLAVGTKAMMFNTTGYINTALGGNALRNNTTGAGNTAVGYSALSNNISGINNTVLGTSANVASANLSNATAIGYNASVDASNKVRIGNTGVSSIGGQVGWSIFSDGRYKKDIRENVPGLAVSS